MSKVGLVVIGRNEGERLRQCLESVLGTQRFVVYVDSGSTDGSIDLARSLEANVVELDLSIPFTAARARNEGFSRLLEMTPELKFVQFVDGDCQIVDGWLELAQKELESNEKIAVVCGRRRERYPDHSIYNRLCDLEWDTPVGETKACGGDAMMRVAPFQQVGGFNPTLIAGEEPELCVRLRKKGWKIFRLDAQMTLHDAQITEFSQWWRRNVRSGHAYAEGAWLHGSSSEKHWVKESRSIWFWGLILPAITVGLAGITAGLSVVLLASYPLLIYRIYCGQQQRALNSKNAWLYSIFCTIGKFPQCQGQLSFHFSRLFRKQTALIEYKTVKEL